VLLNAHSSRTRAARVEGLSVRPRRGQRLRLDLLW